MCWQSVRYIRRYKYIVLFCLNLRFICVLVFQCGTLDASRDASINQFEPNKIRSNRFFATRNEAHIKKLTHDATTYTQI